MSKEIDNFMPHADELELRVEAFKLAQLLRALLAQSDDVHRYSSWSAMCEYNQTEDARDAARKHLSA